MKDCKIKIDILYMKYSIPLDNEIYAKYKI